MQKSAIKSESEKTVRSIWRVVNKEDHNYVHRCSVCGYFKKELRMHWFFTGLYCIACIQDILWDNARNLREMT